MKQFCAAESITNPMEQVQDLASLDLSQMAPGEHHLATAAWIQIAMNMGETTDISKSRAEQELYRLISWSSVANLLKTNAENATSKFGASNTAVYRYLKVLSTLGLVRKKEHGLGDHILYELLPPQQIDVTALAELRMKKSKSVVKRNVLFKPELGRVIKGVDNVKAVSQWFFNGLAAKVYRSSVSDSREQIETSVGFGNSIIKMTSESLKSEGISTQDDVYTQRIIQSMVKQINKERESQIDNVEGNEYLLDINQMCQLGKRPANTSNKQFFTQSLNRLYATDIKVEFKAEATFAKKLQNSSANETHRFRFITDLKFCSDPKNERDASTRYFVIQLNNNLYEDLLSNSRGKVFVAHEELFLAVNRDGMLQLEYDLLSADWVGRTVGAEDYEISFSDLSKSIGGGRKNFRRDYLSMMRAQAKETNQIWSRDREDEGGNYIVLFGYARYFYRQGRKHMIRYSRDRDDRIVGDNSYHNQMLLSAQPRMPARAF